MVAIPSFLLPLQVYKEFLGQVKALTIHHLLDQFVRSKGTGKAIPGKNKNKKMIDSTVHIGNICLYVLLSVFFCCFLEVVRMVCYCEALKITIGD